MTREEAIESLEAIRDTFLICYGEETVVDVPIDGDDVCAIDRAIEALKTQPCEIIRCKNCDEWREYKVFFGDEKYCCVHHCNTGEDYFCGDAVKRW